MHHFFNGRIQLFSRRIQRGRKLLVSCCAIVFIVIASTPAAAEIYRWVDKEGKVHYSDRKLVGDAEDITAQVRIHNIDSSQEEQRKLQQIFRPENDADREYYRQQQEAQKPSRELVNYCTKLRTHQRRMSGRVQIVDDQGKEVRFTEQQRQEHLEETQKLITERCAHVS